MYVTATSLVERHLDTIMGVVRAQRLLIRQQKQRIADLEHQLAGAEARGYHPGFWAAAYPAPYPSDLTREWDTTT